MGFHAVPGNQEAVIKKVSQKVGIHARNEFVMVTIPLGNHRFA